ncbi:MAG: zinc ABC transporter substrate-binding protein [Bifidobacterium sp.]|jgi:zinc/manganese transport system substrate-binding protein|nr:zinc ABC transporter substrate-binding protein [Bifidobacterium sp.]
MTRKALHLMTACTTSLRRSISRRTMLRRFVALAAAAGMTMSVAACDMSSPDPKRPTTSSAPTGPIAVVASLRQWGSLAKEIGGDDVAVDSILSPASDEDAQDFEPKSADAARLQHASIVVTNGAGYDTWTTKNLSKGTIIVSAAETIGAMEGDNPHLWLSKDARLGMASELAEAFSKALPSKKKSFAARLKEWRAKEVKIDEELADFAGDYANTPYAATGTSAFYLMDDMGFKDATPQGYSQALLAQQAPSAADVAQFHKLLEGGAVKLLVDTNSAGNAKSGADSAGAHNETDTTGDSATPADEADMLSLLYASAKNGSVPIVKVPMAMPEGDTTLDEWITALIKSIATTMAADMNAGEPGDVGSPAQGSPSPSATGPSSSSQH